MIDRYRRWFEYERDSHAKTLAALKATPESLRDSEEFGRAVYLMGHIIAARRMWLFRFDFLTEKVELFPRETTFEELEEKLLEMESSWSKYLEQLDDAKLESVFEYESYEGQRFQNTIEEILTQLFGHSWYHRGQIAQLLRTIGAEPAVTDFVFWARRPV
jgi:uncharacterized damage-inducible protein DinB